MTGVQERKGAGTGSGGDERRLEDELERWTAASIITAEQAESIRRLETEEARRAPPPSRIPLIAQALGFLGGALAVIAGIVATSRAWDQLSTSARLTLVGVVTVVFVGAGRVVRREGEPALAHLGSFLWVLATGGAAFWAGILAVDVLDWTGAGVVWVVGVVALAVAAGLWAWRPAPLQHVAALIAMAVTVGGIAGQVQHIGGRFIGLALWALGVIWVVLAWKGIVKPTWLGYAAGGLVTIVGGAILGASGGWADALVILTALALLGASVPSRSMVLLWVGVVAVFASVPAAISRHFGDSLGTPVALLLAGLSLIGVAVVASRLVGQVRARPPSPARFSPTTIAGSLFGVVAVVVAFTVGLTEIKDVPTFPSLSQAPDTAIAGTIAFVRTAHNQRCVYVAPASGVSPARQLLCQRDLGTGPGGLSWNAAGHIVASVFGPEGQQDLEIDPATGGVVSRQPSAPFDKQGIVNRSLRSSDNAEIVVGDSRSGRPRLTVREASGASRTVLATVGPSDYRFDFAIWSPDGRYVAVVDSEERLLIVDVKSPSPTARLLVSHAFSPAWSTWPASG